MRKPNNAGKLHAYLYIYIWMFPKIGVPQNGWFIMENPIQMDDLGVPLFLETSMCVRVCVCVSILQKKVWLDGWTFDVVFVRGTSKSWTTAKVAPFDVQILS